MEPRSAWQAAASQCIFVLQQVKKRRSSGDDVFRMMLELVHRRRMEIIWCEALGEEHVQSDDEVVSPSQHDKTVARDYKGFTVCT